VSGVQLISCSNVHGMAGALRDHGSMLRPTPRVPPSHQHAIQWSTGHAGRAAWADRQRCALEAALGAAPGHCDGASQYRAVAGTPPCPTSDLGSDPITPRNFMCGSLRVSACTQ